MNGHTVLDKLRENIAVIRTQFAVRKLSVFGSFARKQEQDCSDLDVLVSFQNKDTFDLFMDLKFYLEDLLEVRVDLVTENALRPQVRQSIEKELIDVA
jgi:predicted nucleotidyltransferase